MPQAIMFTWLMACKCKNFGGKSEQHAMSGQHTLNQYYTHLPSMRTVWNGLDPSDSISKQAC